MRSGTASAVGACYDATRRDEHDNTTARTVAVKRGEPINTPALTAMLKQIIANNRAGGWRRVKREA